MYNATFCSKTFAAKVIAIVLCADIAHTKPSENVVQEMYILQISAFTRSSITELQPRLASHLRLRFHYRSFFLVKLTLFAQFLLYDVTAPMKPTFGN